MKVGMALRARMAGHGARKPELPIERLIALRLEMTHGPARVRLLIDHQGMGAPHLVDGRRHHAEHEPPPRKRQVAGRQHESDRRGHRPGGDAGLRVEALLREPQHPCLRFSMAHAAAHEVRAVRQLAPDGRRKNAPGGDQFSQHGIKPPGPGSGSP
jgi:hypothetical protein